MEIYFVTSGNKEELEVIRELRPPTVLCSYWYFKSRPLSKFCESIGYVPKILLDSGAYSAYTKGKTINILDYITYIKENMDYLSDHNYISLDVIGDPWLTLEYYVIMRYYGLKPIPVYHYGDDEKWLWDYLAKGEKTIALGGTVPIKNKALVAEWCRDLKDKFPKVDFHLLGSCSKRVLNTGALVSCDASSWYMMAVNGFPKSIDGKSRTSKIERAKYQMKQLMELIA